MNDWPEMLKDGDSPTFFYPDKPPCHFTVHQDGRVEQHYSITKPKENTMNKYVITSTLGSEFTTTGHDDYFDGETLFILDANGNNEAVFTHVEHYSRETVKQQKRKELEERVETMDMKCKDAVSSMKMAINAQMRAETIAGNLAREVVKLEERLARSERLAVESDKVWRDINNLVNQESARLRERIDFMRNNPKRKW